jgi:putative PIN family toxin of toxin-antitoxin system
MIKVVLDTNVLVSAHLKEQGLEADVLRLALAEAIALYVTQQIMDEYEFVLRRPKFSLQSIHLEMSISRIRAVSIAVTPKSTVTISPDETDNRFLECAEESHADYLVTGNKRHFPKRWKTTAIVNARQFLETISPELKS